MSPAMEQDVAKEIERKFLVTGDGWREAVISARRYRQGYLGGERCSCRVRTDDQQAWLNIKSATIGIERTEFEYEIPLADGLAMLDELVTGALIEKTRHDVRHGGAHWEVDVFEGDNAGLVVAEIELTHADASFERPSWIGREVSGLRRYYNVCLVDHPYARWSESERAGD